MCRRSILCSLEKNKNWLYLPVELNFHENRMLCESSIDGYIEKYDKNCHSQLCLLCPLSIFFFGKLFILKIQV